MAVIPCFVVDAHAIMARLVVAVIFHAVISCAIESRITGTFIATFTGCIVEGTVCVWIAFGIITGHVVFSH